jgi:signal transduction histidine kinase
LAAFIAGIMSRPLNEMAISAKAVGEGRFDVAVHAPMGVELKSLARSLNDMSARLAELEEVKREFIAVLSHDMKTPLAAISSYADHLRQGALGSITDGQRDAVDIIDGKAGELSGLADDILNLEKIRAGKLELREERFDAAVLINRVARFYKLLARKRDVTLTTELPPTLSVEADPGKIERAVTNLIANALKFAPDEAGRVTVTLARASDGIRLTVTDNGPGISPDDQKKLFRKFGQVNVEAQKRRRIDGTGLGLTIVKSVAEAHGGRVDVVSAPERGAAFSIILPLERLR